MVLRGSKTHPSKDVVDLTKAIHAIEKSLSEIEEEEQKAEHEIAEAISSELTLHGTSDIDLSNPNVTDSQKQLNQQLLLTLQHLSERVQQLEEQQKSAQKKLAEYNKELTIALQQLACGGVAGAVARTTVAPIDRVKLLIQTSKTRGEATLSIVETAKKAITEGGIRSLWKGNFTNCIRVFPYAAIQFASYERYKALVIVNVSERFNREFGFLERLLSGALAGGTAATLTYPLDVMRVRQACFNDIKGPIDAFRHIYAENGVVGFFRGWVPTVCSLGPFIALNFATFDALKSKFIPDGNTKDASPILVLGLGGSAGIFAQTFCYPLDTIRRNMQMPGNNFNSVFDCIKKIATNDGFRGFYRGIIPNAIKIVPNNGIRFLAYTKLTAYLGIPTTKVRPKRRD